MRRARGFTLLEILVSLSLASLLIAGAFQIHAIFTAQSQRQKQLNDMQQSLRISMQTIERAIRGARMGMSNGAMVLPATTCIGLTGARTFYGVQFYNKNTWPPPAVNNGTVAGFDTTTGTNDDTDPDILRVVSAADVSDALAISASPTTINTTISQPGWNANDFLMFMNTTASTPTLTGCVLQIGAAPLPVWTAVTPSYFTQNIQVATGGISCVNAGATCLSSVVFPAPVRHFNNQIYFYVNPPLAANPYDTPKLSLAIVPLSTDPTTLTTANLTMLTDDIEDMQIAFIMNDGRVCFDHDEVIPPQPAAPTVGTSCDPTAATAVRITLVARTTLPRVGALSTWSPPGGYEDEPTNPLGISNDGRLRRALTSEINLRN